MNYDDDRRFGNPDVTGKCRNHHHKGCRGKVGKGNVFTQTECKCYCHIFEYVMHGIKLQDIESIL